MLGMKVRLVIEICIGVGAIGIAIAIATGYDLSSAERIYVSLVLVGYAFKSVGTAMRDD